MSGSDRASSRPASPKWRASAGVSGTSAAHAGDRPAPPGSPDSRPRLGRPVEQLLWMAGQVLVELILAGDQQPESRSAAAGAAPLLAQRRHGAGEADRDRAVEHANVDAQLKRAGGDHAEQGAVRQPAFDRAALLGCVAGAVWGDAVAEVGRVQGQSLAGVPVDQLAAFARADEHDRPLAAGDQPGEQRRRFAQRARPDAELGVEQGRVPRRRPRGPRPAPRRPRSPRTGPSGQGRAAWPGLAIVADARMNAGRRKPERSQYPPQPGSARSRRATRTRRGGRGPRRPRRCAGGAATTSAQNAVRRQDPGVQHVRVGQDTGSPSPAPGVAPPAACRRRRSPAAGWVATARTANAPGPGRGPWSGTGTRRGSRRPARSRSAPAG